MKKFFFVNLILWVATTVNAFELTNKTVNVIVPFPPGGGVDLTFQNFKRYADTQKINLVANYKPGADGLIGMVELSNAPNNGLTVGIATTGNIATYWTKKNDESLMPLSGIRNSISVIVVNNKSNIKTFQDYKKSMTNDPGFSIGVGAPGQKMLVNQLLTLLKVENKPLIVPYKGGAAVLNDLQGGHITTAILPLSLVAKFVDSGNIRIIALNSDKPVKNYNAVLLKNVVPGWEDIDWYHFVLPPSTPEQVKLAWVNLLDKYLADKEVQKSFLEEFTEPVPRGSEQALTNVKRFVKKME